MKNLDIISRRCLEMFVCALALATIEMAVSPIVAASQQPVRATDFTFTDPLHGWISIEGPTPAILRTSDGGVHWVRFPLPFKPGFYLLRFFDLKTGVAFQDPIKGETLIYSTIDGGRTWKRAIRVSQPKPLGITGMTLVGSEGILAVGERPFGLGWVAKMSTRTGDIQVLNDLPVDASVESGTVGIFGDGNRNLWIVGKHLILHSSDDGKTWENQYGNSVPRADQGISGTALLGGLASFSDGDKIYMTHDYGQHWAGVEARPEKAAWVNLYGVAFFDSQRGCAVGSSSFVYCTSDGGVSWAKRKEFQEVDPDKQSTVPKILALSSQEGMASIDGVLYRTKDGGNSFEKVSLEKVTNVSHP